MINKSDYSKLISIDFDGVLNTYDGFKGEEVTGAPIVGAKEFIKLLINAGYIPIIFTTRPEHVIKKWLKINEFPEIEVTNIKYPSVVYIDDRCIQFNGDFDKLLIDLRNFDTHWRGKDKKKIFHKI